MTRVNKQALDTPIQPSDSPDESSLASQLSFTLEPNDARHLASLCGQLDCHLRQIEQRLGVRIRNRSNHFTVDGAPPAANATAALLNLLYSDVKRGVGLSPESVHLHLQQADLEHLVNARGSDPERETSAGVLIRTKRASIKPRGKNQQGYVQAIGRNDINFGIGPAGTGKTYLAVACAVQALLD